MARRRNGTLIRARQSLHPGVVDGLTAIALQAREAVTGRRDGHEFHPPGWMRGGRAGALRVRAAKPSGPNASQQFRPNGQRNGHGGIRRLCGGSTDPLSQSSNILPSRKERGDGRNLMRECFARKGIEVRSGSAPDNGPRRYGCQDRAVSGRVNTPQRRGRRWGRNCYPVAMTLPRSAGRNARQKEDRP